MPAPKLPSLENLRVFVSRTRARLLGVDEREEFEYLNAYATTNRLLGRLITVFSVEHITVDRDYANILTVASYQRTAFPYYTTRAWLILFEESLRMVETLYSENQRLRERLKTFERARGRWTNATRQEQERWFDPNEEDFGPNEPPIDFDWEKSDVE